MSRDRDDDRRSRDRDDDRGSSRGRDRDDDRSSRGRDRDDDRGRGRDRDDERSSRGRDRDDDRGGRSGRSGGRRFEYTRRSDEDMEKRATQGPGDYDKLLKDGIKMWKVNDGVNRIRILPPTWPGAKHYGYDAYVHYGVGADRQSYLCLQNMLEKPDPIDEARQDARLGNDEKLSKDLSAKKRVLVYIIDRDHEKEGVQAWFMPWTMDRDIVKVSKDRSSGEVYTIDHPEDGFDVEFEKRGKGDRTEYMAVAIARRSTPLGKDEWLDFAMDNPLPDQLNYFDYEHIAKVFNGGGGHRERGGRDRDDDRDSRSRDRDDDRSSRSRDDDDRDSRSRDRDDDRGRGRDRDEDRGRGKDELTWESIHDMTKSELEDLVDDEGLHDVNPGEAKDNEDLADWICEEMGIKKPEAKPARSRVNRSDDRDDGGGASDRLRRMREGR